MGELYLIKVVCLFTFCAVPFAQRDVSVDLDRGGSVAIEAQKYLFLLTASKHRRFCSSCSRSSPEVELRRLLFDVAKWVPPLMLNGFEKWIPALFLTMVRSTQKIRVKKMDKASSIIAYASSLRSVVLTVGQSNGNVYIR